MIRKSTLILVITISILISYGGCNGNDGSMPPEFDPVECRGCPCDFETPPMTAECWVTSTQAPNFFIAESDCFLWTNPGSGDPPHFDTTLKITESKCEVSSDHPACRSFLPVGDISSKEELEACVSCLEQYVTALHAAGFPISGFGPPFKCNFK